MSQYSALNEGQR